MKRTQLLHLALLLVSALFMGCATGLISVIRPARVNLSVTRPAQVNLRNFDKIAIGEIKGDKIAVGAERKDKGVEIYSNKYINIKAHSSEHKDEGGHSFSDDLIQALLESGRFEVLDYEALKMALSQNNLVMSSLTDGGNEEEIRKLFGSIVLISGSILNNYDEDLTHKDVTPAGYVAVTDEKTGEIKMQPKRKYRRKGTATVSVSLRIVDLRTSEILAQKNFTERKSKEKSKNNAEPARIDSTSLLKKCQAKIIRSFVRMIAPYTEKVYVSFETAKEIPELRSGFEMVRLGNWDAATDIFQKVTEIYSDSPLVHKAYYNLGLSYMYTDQFDQAHTALEGAYARKPKSKYRDAFAKLNVRIKDKRRLEEQRPVDLDMEEDE